MDNMKLVICRGIQASGKSTWALEQLKHYEGCFKRLNRDLLREMLDGGKYNYINEAIVTDVEVQLAERLLASGYDVIVDDTNLSASTIEMWQAFAARVGAEMEVKDFTGVPLEECLRRNAERTDKKPIPEQDIRDMYEKHIGAEREA